MAFGATTVELRSHAEVFKACFNLTKRLMVESMRFFECVVHTETLRVKSFTVDYEARHRELVMIHHPEFKEGFTRDGATNCNPESWPFLRSWQGTMGHCWKSVGGYLRRWS